MQERLRLLGALSNKAGIKAKSERLTALAQMIPDVQDCYDRARGNLAAQERLLEDREDILLAQVEGKNTDARKASLLAAKQGDREWQQLQNIVNTVKAQVLDASLELEGRKREWTALTIQIHVFTSTLEFLAGAQEKEEANRVTENG